MVSAKYIPKNWCFGKEKKIDNSNTKIIEMSEEKAGPVVGVSQGKHLSKNGSLDK